jgi:hypothetical protein
VSFGPTHGLGTWPSLSRAALVVLAIVGMTGFIACAGPRDTVIPTETGRWDSDLRSSLDRLSGSDRQLAVAYLDRTKASAALNGQAVPAGVTLGQAIDNQRSFEQNQAQQRLASRNQSEQQDQQRKDAEQRAASAFAVTLLAKELIPADLSSGTRSDQVAFTFEFKNVGAKDLSGVKGTLLVADNFFGTELKTIPLDYRETLPIGATESFQTKLLLSPSAIIDQRVRNTDLSQMKVTFTPELIQFADGTRMDFSTARAQP